MEKALSYSEGYLSELTNRVFGEESGIKIKFAPNAGRYVVSGDDLGAGDTVLFSVPYSHSIGEHCIKSVCDFCCRIHHETGVPFDYKCPDCGYVYFCTQSCKNARFTSGHARECGYFKLTWDSKLDNLDKTKLRHLIRLLCNRVAEEGRAPQTGSLFSDVISLVDHDEDEDDEDYYNIIKEAKRILPAKYIFGTDKELYHLLSKIDCNQFGIWSPEDEFLGASLHPLASFFNHSCMPNCYCEMDGVNLVFKTLYPVPKNTELMISYISAGGDTETRREELDATYSFTCQCSRCTSSDKSAFNKFYHRYLQCPKCPGLMKFDEYVHDEDGTVVGETRSCMTCAHPRTMETDFAPALDEFVQSYEKLNDE